MGCVFHLIVVVNDVDASVDKSEVGINLGVAGIKHIGQQSQTVVLSVSRNAVVLVC